MSYTQTDLFGIDSFDNGLYTMKVDPPQYLPKNECPKVSELYNTFKYDTLLTDIYKADIPEDIKDFLVKAATRHIQFNYSKVADYYAHAPKNIQELFEKSALVIIDIDDAIANGYVKLSKNIADIMAATGRPAGEK